jgi:hypothetical protein
VELQARDDEGKGLAATFEVGASFSFSQSVAYSTTVSLEKTLNETVCGYWTFVPKLVE